MRDLLLGTENTIIRHHVLHYIPKQEDVRLTTAELASPFVVKHLSNRLLTLSSRSRESLREMFRPVPNAAALLGHIFEVDSHEALRHGATLHSRLLPSPDSPSTTSNVNGHICLESTEVVDEFKINSLGPSAISLGPYHKPISENLESIDSFYLKKANVPTGHKVTKNEIVQWTTGSVLLLFQVTVSRSHDVNASGIIYLLDKLGLLEAVGNVPTRAALVFVVP